MVKNRETEPDVVCPRCFCPARSLGDGGLWRCLSALCRHLFKVIAVPQVRVQP